jgi:hypothetical protein
LDGPEDGGDGSGAQVAVRIEHLTIWLLEFQGGSHISIAALLQVGLQEETLQFASFGLLLELDLVQRELESAGGSQPGLQARELNQRRCGLNRRRSCNAHRSYGNLTVRTMSGISVSKGGARPTQRNASLERHTQRFFDVRRDLEEIGVFCKGTVLNHCCPK